MKGRKSPGMVINPGITPRGNVGPMAAVIGSPARFNSPRDPDMSVLRLISPSPLVIKVLITDHVGRYIARRFRMLPSSITRLTPAFERILIRSVVQPV